MKNSIRTDQTGLNAPKGSANRIIAKFIAVLILLNWAVDLHFVSAAETPRQQQSAQAAPILWNTIGAAAVKEYHGDGLAVSATDEGARLHCVFQKLEGHATRDGLWLVSTRRGAFGRSGRSANRARHGPSAGPACAL